MRTKEKHKYEDKAKRKLSNGKHKQVNKQYNIQGKANKKPKKNFEKKRKKAKPNKTN